MRQKIITGFILTLFIVVFIPVYWAMEPARQETARIRQQAEAVARGAKIYSSVCATCHGSQGEGIVAPALKGTWLDEDALVKIINRGTPGGAMPAWGVEDGGPLKENEVNDLVKFISDWDSVSQAPPPAKETTLPPAETSPEKINASQIFAVRCSSCHGANREGIEGFAPALTPERLTALTDDQITDVITNGRAGTAMPPFKGMINPDEIDALLQFIKYNLP